ncbi:MAG: hydantoinase/oxoprolinase family protein, partial [Chloroflexi bacterium]|nr:hydantoinase/oxoprolinase family protein [Chloroflexota bacterium]
MARHKKGVAVVVIGVDVGGTFTDVACLVDGATIHCVKVPTRPTDIAGGVLEGVTRVLRLVGQPVDAVERIVHGTTVATNAIVQRKGAVTGLLATKGFEDILEIGRLKRSRMYDLMIDAQTPTFIAPRRQRLGIRERVGSRGEVIEPLHEEDVVAAVTHLRERFGVEAIAVAYLFSFQNPAHEVRTREIIKERFPGIAVSISSEVHPQYREYERTCVTAFDAYLRPVMEQYLVLLEAELQRQGVGARLQVMQSRGGITSAALATQRPVHLFLSGPAAGVIGGKFAAEQAGSTQLITLDMGGTSNDVALVTAGRPLITTETRILDYPVPIPMVDVHTIGAGGGSLAWIDSGGGLQVGPESAGADPGPVCYGKGGT